MFWLKIFFAIITTTLLHISKSNSEDQSKS